MTTRGRITLACAAAAAAAAVLGGAAAFACTNLATLGISSPNAKAGTALTLTGTSFAAPSEGAPPSPVDVHWNAVDGPVVATMTPDASGNVTGSFTPAETTPGHYVIIATQVDEDGKPQFGTPARVPFEILGPSGEAAPPPAAAPVETTSSSSSGDDDATVPLALVAVVGVVAFGVFAAGIGSLQRDRSRRQGPATAPAAQPTPDKEPSHRA